MHVFTSQCALYNIYNIITPPTPSLSLIPNYTPFSFCELRGGKGGYICHSRGRGFGGHKIYDLRGWSLHAIFEMLSICDIKITNPILIAWFVITKYVIIFRFNWLRYNIFLKGDLHSPVTPITNRIMSVIPAPYFSLSPPCLGGDRPYDPPERHSAPRPPSEHNKVMSKAGHKQNQIK